MCIMKKSYYVKGMAALAVVLAAVGCAKKDLYDAEAKKQESATNFVNNVMGGRSVDGNQTWSTATATTLNVSSEIAEGTLKVYASNPVGQSVAPIYTTTIAKGEQKTFTVARPSDVQRLYVVVYDSQNYMRYQPVNVTGNNLSVKFVGSEAEPASSRVMKAPGRTFTNSHEFATAPADGDFATELPATYVTDTDANGGGQGVNVVIQSPIIGYLNLWNAGSNVYFPAGNWTVNGQYVGQNSKVYLLPGAHVTFNGEYNLNSEHAALYIASGATLTATNISYNFKLYNRGTIYTGNMSQYANGWVYNEGEIYATGHVAPKNNFSEFVNVNKLEAQSMTVEGSGHVLNMGSVTIHGDVSVNSNNCSWVNDGTFHCKNFKYTAGSWNVINNCKLICDEQFYITLGDGQGEFKLDGSVECNTFFHGTGITRMAGKSIIKVAETLTCHADADGRYYGFYGPENSNNGYAVVQAKKITASSLTQRRSISYRNYLIVATDDHWEQCDQSDGNYPYWDQGNNVKMSLKNKNDITETITPTDCNAGIDGGPIIIDEPTMYYYYAFEDLGTTNDFDFNDVIVRVSAPVNGQSSAQIVAAGGTLETYVTYGTQENPTQLGGEVHATMGSNTTSVMINTTSVDTSKFANIGTIDVSGKEMDNLPLGIKVKGNNGEVVKVVKSVEGNGKAPLVIVVTGNDQGKWFWATERTNITVAYSQFGDWGANVGTNLNWFRTPTGAVVNY